MTTKQETATEQTESSWNRWYLAVAGFLMLQIVVYYLLSQHYQ